LYFYKFDYVTKIKLLLFKLISLEKKITLKLIFILCIILLSKKNYFFLIQYIYIYLYIYIYWIMSILTLIYILVIKNINSQYIFIIYENLLNNLILKNELKKNKKI